MFEGKLKKDYKTSVKHTICDLGHALLTHHYAPRMYKTQKSHLEGSWMHLGASCLPPGSHLGVTEAWKRHLAAVPLRILSSGHLTAQNCMFQSPGHLAA